MGKTFYSQAKSLELYKLEKSPSPEIINFVISKIHEDKFARFFFMNLENPAWITPLYNNGFFHNPPDLIEVQPGSFQSRGWPAGEYLVRFTDRYEQIVIDIIQSTRTENWRVHEILVDAMMKISPASAAGQVSIIDTWLSGRFSDMLPVKLLPLADHLIEKGFVDAAIQILESVITPVLLPTTGEYSKYRSPVRFRSDHYWVNEYCEKQLPKLLIHNPLGVVSAFERQLIRAIELTKQTNPDDFDVMIGYVWQREIPNQYSERGDADAQDILVDGLRNGLEEVCKQFIKDGTKVLETYLSSQYLIFRRIALHTLRTHGQNHPILLNQVFSHRVFLENGEYANEFRGLMRNQFVNASKEAREQVIAWIISGPLDVDSRAIRRAQWENREVTDDDRSKVRDEWRLYHLELIRDFLSDEVLEMQNRLVKLHGKPDTEEKHHIVTTSRRGVSSPMSAEELTKLSLNELKQIFLAYVPEDLFLNPREDLAQVLQGIVRADPSRYTAFATYLNDPAIRFIYINYFLSGIRETLKNQTYKLGDDIISLCEYVVAQDTDPFEASSGRYEPGLFAAQMEVARLLEITLGSKDPYLTRNQLDRIRSLLIALSSHPDPEKVDADSSFDPFTHSLNCVRGIAMHGVMQYSLYIIRQKEDENGGKLNIGFLENEIKKLLEEKLDQAIEPSLAVRSVYGAFFPQLHYLDRRWLEEHVGVIFPEGDEEYIYWKAAWDGYIFSSNVYRDVFILLIPQYQRGVRLLSQPKDEQKHLGGSPNARLAQHLMFAYLADLTDFGHENLLLDLFFANAPDTVRADGVMWLSQVLRNDKPSVEDSLWKKCWNLWQNRLRTAEIQEIPQNTQEISEYINWLDNCPVGLELLYPNLCQTVKYLCHGFEARQLTSYAAEHCERFTLEAVALLQMTILSAKEPWWAPAEEDEEKILRTAMTSGNTDAKHIAIEVINYQGERGDFQWRNLLDLKSD